MQKRPLHVVFTLAALLGASSAVLATPAGAPGHYAPEAVAAYRKAIELNPGLINGLEDQALLKVIGQGFLDEGLKLVEGGELLAGEKKLLLAGNFMESFALYEALGRCYYRMERWDRAAVLFRKALGADPQSALARAEMARAYVKMGGQQELATRLFCEALVLDGCLASMIEGDATRESVVRALVLRARHLVDGGKPNEAVARLRVAASLKASPDLFVEIGEVFALAGREKDAARAFALAVERSPTLGEKIPSPELKVVTARELFERGVARHAKNELVEAQALFELSMQLDPKGSTAYNLADCAVRQKRLDDAVALYGKAALLEPSLANAYLNLAIIYLDRNQPHLAVERVGELIRRAPGEGQAYELLARAWTAQRKPDEAAGAYRAAVEYDKALVKDLKDENLRARAAESCYRSAVEQYGAKRWRDSLEDLACAAALKPSPKHDFLAGNAHYALGDLQASLRSYEKADQGTPRKPEILNNIGNIHLKLNQYDQALGCFRRAIEADSTYPQSYNNLGICLKKKGLVHEAIAAYKRALDINPDYAAAYYNLGNALCASGARSPGPVSDAAPAVALPGPELTDALLPSSSPLAPRAEAGLAEEPSAAPAPGEEPIAGEP